MDMVSSNSETDIAEMTVAELRMRDDVIRRPRLGAIILFM